MRRFRDQQQVMDFAIIFDLITLERTLMPLLPILPLV